MSVRPPSFHIGPDTGPLRFPQRILHKELCPLWAVHTWFSEVQIKARGSVTPPSTPESSGDPRGPH